MGTSKHPAPRTKLTLVTGYPRYYHQPLLARVAEREGIDFTVVYSSAGGIIPHENEYGQPIVWDRDPVEGFDYRLLAKAHSSQVEGSFLTHKDFDVLPTLRELDPDILWIFGYNSVTLQIAQAFQRIRRRPILIRENQTLLNSRPVWKKLAKQVGLRALFHNAYGLYVGAENKKWFQHFGMPEHRLYFTPYTVDNDALRKEADAAFPERDGIRASFGIPPGIEPVILFVGRLIPKKQPLVLLKAFEEVRREFECSLLVVGSGELEAPMKELVRQNSVPDVYFAGFLNQGEIARAYAAADVFVLPSGWDETWGLVVNEAMNFGLPIIASDKVASATDLVKPNSNGYIVSSDSQSELASALRRVVGSSGLRKAFGARSLAMIEEWNPDMTAQGVFDAVEAALRDRQRR